MAKLPMRKILVPKDRGAIKKSEIRAAIKYAKTQRASKSLNKREIAKCAFHLRPSN